MIALAPAPLMRHLRAALVGALIVVLSALSLIASQRPAHADEATSVTLSPQPLVAGQDLDLTITVTGVDRDHLANYRLEVYVGDALLTTADDVEAWIDPQDEVTGSTYLGPRAYLEPISESQVDDAVWSEAHGEPVAKLDLQIRARYMQLSDIQTLSGTLPVGARLLRGEDQAAWTTTVVSWNRTTTPSLTTVAPILAGSGDLTAEALAARTAQDGAYDRALDLIEREGLLPAVDPSIIDRIQQLGDDAPSTAVAWLERLKDLPAVLPLTYANADLVTLAMAEVDRVPTVDVDWDWAFEGIAIPATGHVRAKAMSLLSHSGYTRAIVSDADLKQAAVTGLETGKAYTTSGMALTASDQHLSDALGAYADSGMDRDLADALAYATRVSTTTPGTGPVVILPDDWASSDAKTERYARAISRIRTVTGMTTNPGGAGLDAVQDDAHKTKLKTVADPAFPLTTAQGLIDNLHQLERFAKLLDEPEPLIAESRRTLLGMLDLSWSEDLDEWAERADLVREEDEKLLASVFVAKGSSLTLASGESEIPIPVTNDSDQPVTVNVHVRPSNGRVTVEDAQSVRVEAHSSATALVPVTAVANGAVELTVELQTASGQRVGTAVTRHMDVRANWETWVTAVGLSAVGGLFVFGLSRSLWRFLKRREKPRD